MQKFETTGLLIRAFNAGSFWAEMNHVLERPSSATAIVSGVPIEAFGASAYFLYDPEKLAILAAYKIDALTNPENWNSEPGVKNGKSARAHPFYRNRILTDYAKGEHQGKLTGIINKMKRTFEKIKTKGIGKYQDKYRNQPSLAGKTCMRWNEVMIAKQEGVDIRDAIIGYGIAGNLSPDEKRRALASIRSLAPDLPRFEYDNTGLLKRVSESDTLEEVKLEEQWEGFDLACRATNGETRSITIPKGNSENCMSLVEFKKLIAQSYGQPGSSEIGLVIQGVAITTDEELIDYFSDPSRSVPIRVVFRKS